MTEQLEVAARFGQQKTTSKKINTKDNMAFPFQMLWLIYSGPQTLS